MESDPPQVRAQGSRVPLWPRRPLRGARVMSGVMHTGGGGIDVDATSPFGSHLVYPVTPHPGRQGRCGRVCLGKEEGSRSSEASGSIWHKHSPSPSPWKPKRLPNQPETPGSIIEGGKEERRTVLCHLRQEGQDLH